MAVTKNNLVVGVFDHSPPAEQAVEDLYRAGFPQDRIDMVTRGEGVTRATPRLQTDTDASTGALAGAVAGASTGAVAGAIAAFLVPGLGAVIGGGLLAGIVGGAALGAAGGTFLGPFLALEMSPDEAHYYSHEIDQGRTVVLVQTADRADEAWSILSRHGARRREAAVSGAR
jgi:outer membrane lipoprotein SlyB